MTWSAVSRDGPALSANGRRPNGASYLPAISGDGRWLAFVSNASDLAPGDRNDVSDIYLRDLVTSTTRLVSGAGGRAGDGGSTSPALSHNGRFVAFQSEASDLVCRHRCTRQTRTSTSSRTCLCSIAIPTWSSASAPTRMAAGWSRASGRQSIRPAVWWCFPRAIRLTSMISGNDADLFVWTACAGDSGR